MDDTNFKIKFFGSKLDKNKIISKINLIKNQINQYKFFLIIAGTNTSQVEGISSAGIDSESRKITPLADAEFLIYGPTKNHKYTLPSLKAGVTPALISNVCAALLKTKFDIVPLGVYQKPYFKYLSIDNYLIKPANCLSSGNAMPKKRVKNLFDKGFEIGKNLDRPIFISESVPGGTTTAQAIMEAFGLNVSNLVGSSLLKPPRNLKKEIISKGILNSNLKKIFNSIDVIASLGDPFQAFSMGLLIGARKKNKTVILAGGSQMITVLLLALEYIDSKDKQNFVDQTFIITTSWLARDNSLNKLLDLVSERHKVNLYGFASCLNFNSSKLKELKDYEIGYVKEGVGAGALSLLAYLKGFKYEEIVSKCEDSLLRMKKFGQIAKYDETND